MSGATVSLSGGPSSATPLVTDANGCAVFGGLSGGSYTVTAAESGYVSPTNATSSTTSVTVVPTLTAPASLTLALAGGISATFTTKYNGTTHASSADQVMAAGGSPTQFNLFGTPSTLGSNSYVSTLASGNSYYPGGYTVFAGSCSGDSAAGGSQVVNVTGGSTSAASLALPAMIVTVNGSTTTEVNDSNIPAGDFAKGTASSSGWASVTGQSYTAGDYNGDETRSATGGNTMTYAIPLGATSVQWIGSLESNHGYASVYINGVLASANVDTYGGGSGLAQQTVWQTSGLNAGQANTLTIVVSGTLDFHSCGNYVSIDAITYSTPSLLSTAPLITITDNNTGCSGEDYPASQVPTPTQGALVDPGQPYGNYTVCASSGGVKNTATVANTDYAAGNPVTINLASGASGVTSGSCT